MDKKKYKEYTDALEDACNGIELPKSVKTRRKGVSGIRDKLVFYKTAWGVAESWAALPKAFVFWLGLTPLAIANFNEFMKFIGSPIYLPIGYTSLISVVVVCVLMIFGFYSMTKIGLNRRSLELGGKQNPTYFLLYVMSKMMIDKIDNLENEIKDLKNE